MSTIKPALGYRRHTMLAHSAGLAETAEFIEAQAVETEFLYAALQRVRARAAGSRGSVCRDVLAIAEAALRYETP